MDDEKVTTIQIDVGTREKLRILGVANERSAAGQLRWMVSQDFEKLTQAQAAVTPVAAKRKKRIRRKVVNYEQPQA